MYTINYKDYIGRVKTSIFEITIDDEEMNQQIINQIELQGDRQNLSTNVKAQMTDWDMRDKPGFNKLAGIICLIAAQISKLKYNINFHPTLINIWGMKYQSNNITKEHNHWPSVWSCAYYINPPEDCPGLYFQEFFTEIKPKNGLLLMFEGWVKHEVMNKTFKNVRYVVSANIDGFCSDSSGC